MERHTNTLFGSFSNSYTCLEAVLTFDLSSWYGEAGTPSKKSYIVDSFMSFVMTNEQRGPKVDQKVNTILESTI